ncbi:MAG TPA: alpha/beta hydrolase [Candidatus Kryptonia bacterium]|nr:alpha/beta hydrolase [Candidatus Kryptonia bacterium]
MPTFPQPTHVRLPQRTNQPEMTLAVYEQGTGPAVVFCHGFPELAYSWRHQLPAVAGAGFRAIAPDQRGYGKSTIPARIEDYSLRHLTNDLVGLLDALGIDQAIFVGHDWGGVVVWAMPVLHPQRTLGVVGICTPYMVLPKVEALKAMVDGDDERHYIAWFQKPGVAESVLDPNVRMVFEKLLRGGISIDEMMQRAFEGGKLDMNPFRRLVELEYLGKPILSPEELEIYVQAFERSGFRGGLNWYRNIDRNVDECPGMGTQPLTLPCLMLTAQWDAALRPELAESMKGVCSDLETRMIERAGHWLQQECPEAVNHHLVDWLRRHFA